MSAVGTILLGKLRMSAHLVTSVRNESKLKVGVLTFSAGGLWVGALVLFDLGFRKLLEFGGAGGMKFDFGTLLMGRVLSILGLAVFFMLIFSNLLVVFSTLYRSEEVEFLLHTPLNYRQFFYARFVECVVFSSWALAYLGSPLLLAYGRNVEAPSAFYVAVAAFFLPYITVPACVSALVVMVLVRVFPKVNTRAMVAGGVAALAVFFLYIRHALRRTEISPDAFLPFFFDLTRQTQSVFLPSSWASQGLLEAARGRWGEVFFWWGALASTALFGVWLCGEVAERLFYRGWSDLRGLGGLRLRRGRKGPLDWMERLLCVVPNPHRTLIAKDVRLFWRDPTQWSQFILFFGIMAIYIANLRTTSRYYEREEWKSFVACLNVGAVSLILATLTSRFVFPLVSLEGRRFWILRLAPLTFRQLVWQKFWLSVGTTSCFTVGLALLSGHMLRLEPLYYGLTVYSVLLANFGLAGLAVGLGTLYPTFTEDNPARIVSGMGGTLNLLLSVGYITLVVSAQTLILQWWVLERFAGQQHFTLALIGVLVFVTSLSLLCVFVPMRLGLRHLERSEF